MTERLAHALGWHVPDLTDFEIRLTILGCPFSLKRGKQVVSFGGHASIGLTKEAKAYLRSAAAQLRAQWLPVFRQPIPISIAMNCAIRSYLPDRRRVDASNLYEAPQDAMKCCTAKCKPNCDRHAGVIEDDFSIRTHDGSDRLLDRENPRVEIVLTPYVGADVHEIAVRRWPEQQTPQPSTGAITGLLPLVRF